MGFPLQGIDLSTGFSGQRHGTTPQGVNVRTFEPASRRAKGGNRPGLEKYVLPQLPNGPHLIQHLNIVDPTNADALLANLLDWPGGPSGGTGDPLVFGPAPPSPPDGPPGFPLGLPGFPAWIADPSSPGIGPGHPGSPSGGAWGTTTVADGYESRNPGRIIPVGGTGVQVYKNRKTKILPFIDWANPAPIPIGTVLTSTQLNARALDAPGGLPVTGTLTYLPGVGSKTTATNQKLYVKFVPDDLTVYLQNTRTVTIGSVIAFVQANVVGYPSGSPASPRTLAFASPVAVGNLLVVCVSGFGGISGLPVSVTDSLGNTYAQATTPAGVGGYRLSMWYVISAFAGACTVNVAQTFLDFMGLGILEYSGIKTTGPLDGTNASSSAVTGSGIALTTGSVPVSNYSLLLGAFCQGDAVVVFTPGGGSTLRCDQQDGNTKMALYVEELIGVTSAQVMTGSFPGAHAWCGKGTSFLGA